MKIKSYRARTLHEALQMVRRDLGPDAAVLQTREVYAGIFQRIFGRNEIEVTASDDVHVPSRIPRTAEQHTGDASSTASWNATQSAEPHISTIPAAHEEDYRERFRRSLKGPMADMGSRVHEFYQRHKHEPHVDLPESLFELFTLLLDAEVDEEVARQLLDEIHQTADPELLRDADQLWHELARRVENDIRVAGPVQITPGRRRVVALVGPTGVGKTTTIAKLAANFRLREKRRVGLITVDTYRIAAVEQLRTYADIIDLPMEVAATPREMRDAVRRLEHLDLILMDTAGRSPRDEVRIGELKAMLQEADVDEVQLVLSAVTGSQALKRSIQHFQQVGTTSLLLTKLDEATALGNLIPTLRSGSLPISYITNGQSVPDDIQTADSGRLARWVLGRHEEV